MLSFLNSLTPLVRHSHPIEIPNPHPMLKSSKGKQVKSNKFTGYSILETRLRKLLVRHFGVEFVNVRLPFMRNPVTGRLLELDLYCEQLKLAIEVSGIQHRSSASHFYKDRIDKSKEEQFREQKFRDQLKLRLCGEHGIKFVTIHDSEITNAMLDDEVLNLVLRKIALN